MRGKKILSVALSSAHMLSILPPGTPFQQAAIFFEKGLDNLRAFGIINPALTEWAQKIAGLCKGSTTDSDSVCEGSNPSPAAIRKPPFSSEKGGFYYF